MHHQTHFEIRSALSAYRSKGKKSAYKQKQMKRLVAILEDIFRNEGTERLSAVGRRQLIGYWRRTEGETDQTRREKYSILKRFFAAYNPTVTVPEPKKSAGR